MTKKTIIGVLVGLVLIVLVSSSAQALTMQGTLQYHDYGSGRDEPIAYAEIEIWRFWPCFLGIGGIWKHDYTTGTDGNGWFSFNPVFHNSGIIHAIRVVARNSAVSVNEGPFVVFWRDPGFLQTASSNFDVLDFTHTFGDDWEARNFNIFNTIRHGFDYANARRDPSETDGVNRVNAMIDDVVPNSFYDPITVTLHIKPHHAFDDILLMHEYAHFLEHDISRFAPIISTHDGCTATDIFWQRHQ